MLFLRDKKYKKILNLITSRNASSEYFIGALRKHINARSPEPFFRVTSKMCGSQSILCRISILTAMKVHKINSSSNGEHKTFG